MNTITSIYIPRMSTHWTEITIRQVMLDCHIGYVTHVDFTPVNKKPGFVENVDSVVMSAFLHFSDNWKGNEQFWATIESEQAYKMKVGPKEYWICLKNKNPVQRTLMNIHQVVENGRHLESLITEQAEEIKKLKETVDGLNKVVYQLLGGLFCQRTQEGIMNLQLKTIGIENINGKKPEHDTHPSGIWPTTRQGDDNRKRIEVLEKKFKKLNYDIYGLDFDVEILRDDVEDLQIKYEEDIPEYDDTEFYGIPDLTDRLNSALSEPR